MVFSAPAVYLNSWNWKQKYQLLTELYRSKSETFISLVWTAWSERKLITELESSLKMGSSQNIEVCSLLWGTKEKIRYHYFWYRCCTANYYFDVFKYLSEPSRHSSVLRAFACDMIGPSFEPHQFLVTGIWQRLARLPCWPSAVNIREYVTCQVWIRLPTLAIWWTQLFKLGDTGFNEIPSPATNPYPIWLMVVDILVTLSTTAFAWDFVDFSHSFLNQA